MILDQIEDSGLLSIAGSTVLEIMVVPPEDLTTTEVASAIRAVLNDRSYGLFGKATASVYNVLKRHRLVNEELLLVLGVRHAAAIACMEGLG